ncbi:infB [Lepeophtheirus salmonis]|uniref:InfB n=1 Tax=Lepeophtheirus salmonis TaxID=72036 RepID=A0A7R8CT27_LEPSM|nr:infB [Lepeophtheirus salmonis]CAF2884882.1 infB [Lepeophtheirus salmonis]
MDCISTYDAHDLVKLDIIEFGVGEITDNDVNVAQEFDGIVYAFNVPVSKSITSIHLMDRIKTCNIIYKLMDDIRDEINVRMPLIDKEVEEGMATVLKEFIVTIDKKKSPVGGCKVISGKIHRNSYFRIRRESNSIIADKLKLKSLKHLKDEVPEISKGSECGLMFEDAGIRFQLSDRLECYKMTQERMKTDWNGGL